MAKGKNKDEREVDAKRRLLQKLQSGNKFVQDIDKDVQALVSSELYTQAFLTQWMTVEQIAIHIIRTSVVCNWCEDTFNSISHNLGDVGFKAETFEKKVYEPLFSKYMASRSVFERINADQVFNCLSKFDNVLDEYKIKELLADKLNKHLLPLYSGNINKTVRKLRNEIVHTNYRISKEEFLECEPYFDYFFSVTSKLAEIEKQ